MKNMKAFIRVMMVIYCHLENTVASIAKESKTPVATVRELLTFALEKGFIHESTKNHKVIFGNTMVGDTFVLYIQNNRDIFLTETEQSVREPFGSLFYIPMDC